MTTHFQIASDIHLEQNGIQDPFSIIRPVSPILVLAGDIGSLYDMSQLKDFLSKVCERFQHVIYVIGNHEYYKTLACRRGVPMGDLRQRALSLSRQIENLHVLDRKTVRINNIIFAGATFWSAIEAGGHYPEYIRRSLNVDKRTYRALHRRDAKWILRIINSVGKNDDEKLAIITHYPPSMKTLRTLGTKNEEFYASNREDLLKKNVGVWIYGHTHHNKDFMVNGIRLVSNQKGKKYDRCALCPCKVIEL